MSRLSWDVNSRLPHFYLFSTLSTRPSPDPIVDHGKYTTCLSLSFHKRIRWTLILSSKSQEVKGHMGRKAAVKSTTACQLLAGTLFPGPWWLGSPSLIPPLPLFASPIPVPLGPATLPSLLFFGHTRHFPTLGPLHWLFSLIDMLFPRKPHGWLLSFVKPLLKCHPLSKDHLD